VQAARLAALIGWSAIGHGDRIGALLFSDASGAGTHQELSPAGGRRGQMRLIRALVQAGAPDWVLADAPALVLADARTGTDAAMPAGSGLTSALMRLRRVARPGSLVFLLSDFYRVDGDTRHHLSRLAQHCDLAAIQLLDPLELAPPPPGRYGISDGRRRAVIDTRMRADRERYAQALARHQDGVRRLTIDNGIGLVQCLTTDDPLLCLGELLASRGGMPSLSAAAMPHLTDQRDPAAERQRPPSRQARESRDAPASWLFGAR
jgi:uncharacterized protein (DUF58 family)